jgi:hypothetical protein
MAATGATMARPSSAIPDQSDQADKAMAATGAAIFLLPFEQLPSCAHIST